MKTYSQKSSEISREWYIIDASSLPLGKLAVVIADKPTETADAATGKPVETRPAWSRRLELPFRVDADKASAKFNDGILRIQLPKAESVGIRHIAIEG